MEIIDCSSWVLIVLIDKNGNPFVEYCAPPQIFIRNNQPHYFIWRTSIQNPEIQERYIQGAIVEQVRIFKYEGDE